MKENKLTYEIPEAEVVVIDKTDVLEDSLNVIDNAGGWKWSKNM